MNELRAKNRTTFLTNPKFQLSFLGYTMGMAFVIIAVFYVSNVYFFMKFIAKGKEIGLPSGHVFFKFLREQQHTMDIIFLVTAIFAFVFLFMFGFFLSNRVAGSLYRMQDHLHKMKEAPDYKDLRFRRDDYFHEVADAINDFARHLKK
jgi:hypothetical protein